MDKEKIAERARELESAMYSLKSTTLSSRDETGLKNSEKYFLWQLATLNKGEPVMPSKAAKKLNVTLAAISHRINSLEEQGYVVRSASPNDKRVVFVSLSEKGKKLTKVLRKGHWEKICGLVEYLGDKDSAAVIRLAAKITDYFKNSPT